LKIYCTVPFFLKPPLREKVSLIERQMVYVLVFFAAGLIA
jgi:hypothetical protein